MISETHKSCLVFLIGVMIMTCMPARTDAVVVGAENVNTDMDGSPQTRWMTSRSDYDGDFTNSIGPELIRSSAVITSAGEALVTQVSGSTASKKPDKKEEAAAKAKQAAKGAKKVAKTAKVAKAAAEAATKAAAKGLKGLMDGTDDPKSNSPVVLTGRKCKTESLEILSQQKTTATFEGCKNTKSSVGRLKKKKQWGCDFKITKPASEKDSSFKKHELYGDKYGDKIKAKGSTMRFTDRPSEIAAKVSTIVGYDVSPPKKVKPLAKGATVRLEWNHNYVTCDGSKFPERVITKLRKKKQKKKKNQP